ncbi:zinc ribbon domain-containing protein [Pyxidicoccus caerfyrddinensis]|uniref:zinc ribbon domain-containing protein n=1 Tax=Pyxidicoccus caerfyrddinensis TaxID=2709663 RepID=UPI0013DC60A9|nr:zinc ribbon domain-containing protein [Pyxidicoccus caerfyrddinensis]
MSTAPCPNCQSLLEPEVRVCPYCRQARPDPTLVEGMLARDFSSGGMDGLALLASAPLLARNESIDALTRELEQESAGPLMLAELQSVSDRLAGDAAPGLNELEGLLAKEAAPVSFDGIQLSSLLERGSQDQAVLRKGLVLLRHRRYAEALEWWTLNREALEPSRERLELLLLMMEAFTHGLAGNRARERAVRQQVLAHPLYQQLRGRKR